MSWPRGSKHRPVRIQSYSARKCARFSTIVLPESAGRAARYELEQGFRSVSVDAKERVSGHGLTSNTRTNE